MLLSLLLALGLLGLPLRAHAQDEAGPPPVPDTTAAALGKTAVHPESYPNMFQGEFSPGRGFDVIKTDKGSLNVSFYGLIRYINQTPAEQTFTDHLGNVRTVKSRNDLYWQRSFIWLTGWFFEPRFRYNVSVWSLGATQQTLVFGNLQYQLNRHFNFGAGLGPNLTSRSTQGSWPFWAGSDRQMAEEFFRGGFSSGAWMSGEVVPRLNYNVSTNTAISQLGVTATNEDRNFAYSGTLVWYPTTGEFGPRGGFGDLEDHEGLATRWGATACHVRQGRNAPDDQPPTSTQIRLSDGVFPFETGALANGVTVEKLDYDYYATDFGAKLKGFSFQGEAYFRNLSNFAGNGSVPESSIKDRGFMAEVMQMVVPRTLGLYAATGYVDDAFRRFPWELAGGASFYPYKNRSWRLNLHVIHVEKSPTGSTFGYYSAGQTGTTVSLGTDILF
jgi:hypothetical protein